MAEQTKIDQLAQKSDAEVKSAQKKVSGLEREALGFVNKQLGWADRHPLLTAAGILILVSTVIALCVIIIKHHG